MPFSFRLFLLVIGLAAVVFSCRTDDGRRDIRDYYFPLRELTDGLVYEYRAVGNDSLTPAYWYYRSFLFPDSVFLTGAYYEGDLLPVQFLREQVVRNGMLLEEMYLYERDSTGEQFRSDVTIEAGNAFPFAVRDSGGIFLYKVHWSSPLDPGATTTLIKNRRFLGDTTFVYKNEAYDGVVFEVRELFEYDKEGVFEQEYRGIEVYARGLGLVYYRKDITPELVLEYRLADRYPMKELEEQFRRRYHPERPPAME